MILINYFQPCVMSACCYTCWYVRSTVVRPRQGSCLVGSTKVRTVGVALFGNFQNFWCSESELRTWKLTKIDVDRFCMIIAWFNSIELIFTCSKLKLPHHTNHKLRYLKLFKLIKTYFLLFITTKCILIQ